MTTPTAIRTISPVNTVIQKPQQIWSAGTGIQPLIVNNDPLNTLYVGPKADVQRQDVSSCIPIEPLGSQEWGDFDIYAFAPVAVNTMLIIPGATAWNPSPAQVAISAAGLATKTNQQTQINQLTSNPANTVGAEVASLIANGVVGGAPGGTPLLHGISFLAGPNANITIPAGSSVTRTFAFTKPGYVINVQSLASGASHLPFVSVQLNWQDSGGTVTLDFQDWVIPGCSAGANTYRGTGPVRGPLLSITFTNLDPTNSQTITYSLIQTTQHTNKDDWRGPMNPAGVTGTIPAAGFVNYTLQSGANNFNIGSGVILGIQATGSILGNSSIGFVLPLYCGPVKGLFLVTSGANPLTVSTFICDVLPNKYASTAQNATAVAVTVATFDMLFPRLPMCLEIVNNNAAVVNFQILLVINEEGL